MAIFGRSGRNRLPLPSNMFRGKDISNAGRVWGGALSNDVPSRRVMRVMAGDVSAPHIYLAYIQYTYMYTFSRI